MKRDLRTLYYIPVIYFVLGVLWILLTDRLILTGNPDSLLIVKLQTYKGLAYVTISSLILFLLVSIYARNLERNRIRIQESRNKLRNIIESLPSGIAETSSEGIVEFVSDRFVKVAGIERSRILKRPIQDFFPELSQIMAMEIAEGENPPEVLSIWESSGMNPYQKVFKIRCFSRKAGEAGLRFELTDITREYRRERIQKTLRELDQMIINEQSQSQIFHFLCHRFREIYSLPLCWIGVAEPDFSVRIAAFAGPRKDYLRNLSIRWDESTGGDGPAGRAIRYQQVFRSDNPDMTMGPWAVAMFNQNLKSAVSFPLIVDRKSIGVFSLYSELEQGFRDDVLNELDDVARRISMSISFSLKKETMELFTRAMDSAANVIFVVDHLLRMVWSNRAFQERCKLDGAELYQKPVSEVEYLSGRDYQEALGRTLLSGRVWTGEIIEGNDSNNGFSRIAFLTVTPIESDTGQIRHLAVVQEDITDVRAAEKKIQEISIFDHVTGLPNRRRFHQVLQRMIQDSRQNGTLVGLIVFDIFRFKEINEELGFRGGDLFLEQMARNLVKEIPDTATLFRLDGDLFAVVLEGLENPESAAEIADSVTELFRNPLVIGEEKWTREVHGGMAFFPLDGGNYEQILNSAEVARDRARQLGPGKILRFSEEMIRESRRTLKMHQEIYSALANNQFRLVFQPEFNVITQEVFRFEALMRWNHPDRGEISPASFIPVAEHFGSILDLGNFLFQEILRIQKEWKSRLGRTIPLAINLSPTQFRDPHLVEKIGTLLGEFEEEEPFLELEITETALFSDLNVAETQMNRLRDRRLRISLDDFGTGYSSLSAIRTFPITGLKIDRSFISGILENHRNQAIVKSIIDMAKNMKLTVVAEGTETSSQIQTLRDLGCIRCQGYLFSPPVEAAALVRNMEDGLWRMARSQQLY